MHKRIFKFSKAIKYSKKKEENDIIVINELPDSLLAFFLSPHC